MKSTKGKAAGCALAVGAVFMMFPGTALAADEVWNYRGVVDSLSGVVIRTAASESSGVAGYLQTGGTADVIEAEGDWYLVVSGDVTGYIKSEYLALGDTAEYLAGVYGYEGVETYWDGVALFSEPDANSSIVYEADAYEQFVLLEDEGSWLKVQDEDGAVLYVPAEGVRDTVVMAKATTDSTMGGSTGTSGSQDSSSSDAAVYDSGSTESYETEAPVYETEPTYETEAPVNETESTYETEAPVYETEPTYETEAPVYETEPTYETEAPVYETEPTYETEAPDSGSSSGTSSGSDLDLLAALIYCEAGNQSREGMVAVGAVVMNRVASSSFPNSISEVIYQSGQFTPASSGTLSQALANGVPSSCYEAAQAAMNGENPVGDALYFNAGSGQGMQIGDHQFY
ncbi:MAG TPA: cell wall hydrolase [Candidatus Limivivens intestinipullorum]|uniref:Cell wall hydrolase n=1 Tax=Candidatus Limivivens intestinipullorum TaxID=2840858 RepID=A0A9D1JIJ1_9FIRM|nr:cell wall hydrolase [Candidatus Limivivens intestinipullorum]